MKSIAIIPARLGSTRLPEKALALIQGKTMVQRVYERARSASGLDDVIVATDHQRIAQVVESFGGRAVLTSPDLQSGTDRVAAAAQALDLRDDDIVLNVQGDEPLIHPDSISATLALLQAGTFSMTTAAAPLENRASFDNPNIVKVLLAADSRAIYFSRFSIPYSRSTPPDAAQDFIPLHHLGLYGYRVDLLKRYAALAPTALERAESLEQLRALYHGIAIGVAKVAHRSIGVDTAEDLELVRKLV